MKCEAVLLAAGLGTRMKSRLPKVLHPLAGVPMVDWSIEACSQATKMKPYLVVGPESDEVQRQADDLDLIFLVNLGSPFNLVVGKCWEKR